MPLSSITARSGLPTQADPRADQQMPPGIGQLPPRTTAGVTPSNVTQFPFGVGPFHSQYGPGGIPAFWPQGGFGSSGSPGAGQQGGFLSGLNSMGMPSSTVGGQGGDLQSQAAPIWAAVIPALIGAAGSYFSAKDANKSAASRGGGGSVDMRTSSMPWGPSIGHRMDIMDLARNLFDNAPQFGGGGGGGGGGGAPAVTGARETTTNLGDTLAARAAGGHPLYDTTNQFVSGLMGGDNNQYRGGAYDAFSNLGEGGLVNDLFGALMGGDLQSILGFGGGGSSMGGGGFVMAPGQGVGPTGAAQHIRDYLDAGVQDENPYMDDMVNAVTRDVRDAFFEQEIPGLNAEAIGMNRFGSGAYRGLMEDAASRMQENVGDISSQLRYQDYGDRRNLWNDVLGLGAQYDSSALDRNAQLTASGNAAASSRYAADAGNRTQMALGMLNSLTGLAGMDADSRRFGAAGMLDAGNSLSADRMGALGMMPDLTGMDIRDMMAGLEGNLGIDRLNFEASDRSAGHANAAAGRRAQNQLANQSLYWGNIRNLTDILNGVSGNYGETRELGVDQRGFSPAPPGPSPIGQAIAGGLSAYQIAQMFGQGGAP